MTPKTSCPVRGPAFGLLLPSSTTFELAGLFEPLTPHLVAFFAEREPRRRVQRDVDETCDRIGRQRRRATRNAGAVLIGVHQLGVVAGLVALRLEVAEPDKRLVGLAQYAIG